MCKKLIGIVVMAIMLFGIFGLAACTESLAEYKATKSQALQEYADTKCESNYCAEDWQTVCSAVTDGVTAIEEAESKSQVTIAFDDARDKIDEVKGNFDLTISTVKNKFSKNEEIKVSISLTNQSGKDEEISYFFLITPNIPTATNYPVGTDMPQYPYTRGFQNNETITITNDLGGYFARGKHEIKYNATFYLNWGGLDETTIAISSNIIAVTIN